MKKLIFYDYESINRNAIVVKAKKPMIDWLNQIYPDHPVSENMEGNIYLLRQMDGNEEIKKWLKQNFDPIFQHELNDWNTNEDNWPKNRTFKLFQE